MKMLLTAVAFTALAAAPASAHTPRRYVSHHAHTQYQPAPYDTQYQPAPYDTQYQPAPYYDYDTQYGGGDTAASLDE
jgi:hypothetical protein